MQSKIQPVIAEAFAHAYITWKFTSFETGFLINLFMESQTNLRWFTLYKEFVKKINFRSLILTLGQIIFAKSCV